MSFNSLLPQTVTVVTMTDGATDDFGNALQEVANTTEYKARLEQTDTQELTVGRDTVLSDYRLFLPSDAVISPTDQVVEGGRTFQVVGTANPVYGAKSLHHYEVRLRLIQG